MSLRIKGKLPGAGEYRLDVDLTLPTSGLTAVVGASGSGKTSLLRLIAGLEQPPGGEVYFNDQAWQSEAATLRPDARPLSMAQQESSLFPHLRVRDNILLASRYRPGQSAAEDLLEHFQVTTLLDRWPDELSGGQRQRVMLVQALSGACQLTLFDEPMSALDMASRRGLAPLLAAYCAASGRPFIYVSHALQEVLQIADYLVVMEAGRVIASGTPTEVGQQLDHPVSSEIDLGGILSCRFLRYDARHNLSELALGSQTLWVRGDLAALGETVKIQIPARAVSLARQRAQESSILNQLQVSVREQRAVSGGTMLLTLDCEGSTLFARITSLSAQRLELQVGDKLFALVKSVALETRESGKSGNVGDS